MIHLNLPILFKHVALHSDWVISNGEKCKGYEERKGRVMIEMGLRSVLKSSVCIIAHNINYHHLN